MRYGTFFSHIGNLDGTLRPNISIFVGGTLMGTNRKDLVCPVELFNHVKYEILHARNKG